MSEQKKIVILGAGPCGLGAALRLTELCHENWTCYEFEDEVGGLSRTMRDDNGFHWDVGGHVIFSHYQYFDDMLESLGPQENTEISRKCLIFMNDGDYEINYPLQMHVDELPQEHWQRCLNDLLDAYVTAKSGDQQKPTNFAEWGVKVMGQALVDVFLRPYNEKLWAWPMETMTADWLGERVAVPDFKKVMEKFTKIESRVPGRAAQLQGGWGPNSSFKYPLQGGTGAVWTSLSSHLPSEKIKLGKKVTQLDPVNRSITLADGSTDTYDILINTIALQTLSQSILVKSYPKQMLLQELSLKLRFCSVIVVGLGLKGPEADRLSRFHWGYFPAADVPFYRCTVFSHYSPHLCPPSDEHNQYHSLLFESSFSAHRPLECTLDERVAATEEAARRYGLIGEMTEVVSPWVRVFHFGYPTPSLDRDNTLSQIQQVLEDENIYSRGRFGGWKYEVGNMDHSMMQGVEVIDRVLSRDSPMAREPTYQTPNYVNNPSNRGTERIDLSQFFSLKESFSPATATTDVDVGSVAAR